jgi:enoyl-CoA hydratase
MEKSVIYEKKDGIATVTLNRPERRNAINQDLLINLYNYIEEAANSDDITAIIVTGSGSSFSSGIDLDIAGTDNLLDPRGDGSDLPDVLFSCKKPVIGAVNGHAINAGFELALNCDFLIASESAVFLDTHAKMGLQPGWGLSQLLPQAVGHRTAKQISFTCQPVSAKEALRIGLVNEVLEGDRLMPRVLELAGFIKQVNYASVLKIKELIEHRNEVPHSEAYANERNQFKKFIVKYWKG